MITAAGSEYGYQELRNLYTVNALRSLFAAVCVHLSIVALCFVLLNDAGTGGIIVIRRPIDGWKIGPPPSIINGTALPKVTVAGGSAKIPLGNFIPVPDGTVSPDATVPTQAEMSAASGDTFEGVGTGAVPEEVFTPVEVDPDPGVFTAVEKMPVPVKTVVPVYPEVARRAGMEGTVWVRLLVGKSGAVKKAEVMKTDSGIFDQAAVDAAMLWVFTPAVMNNGPVTVWVSIPFRFRLAGAH